MSSYSSTETGTFTETHAKHIASKVSTDLKRMQRFYGSPSDEKISQFEKELIELLKKGYLDTVTYGYKKDGKWIVPTLRYTAKELSGSNLQDDDPGRVSPNADINGAHFYSFLEHTISWMLLSEEEQQQFENNLPFRRGFGTTPGIDGYMVQDKSYSAGNKGVDRSTLKK